MKSRGWWLTFAMIFLGVPAGIALLVLTIYALARGLAALAGVYGEDNVGLVMGLVAGLVCWLVFSWSFANDVERDASKDDES